MPKAWMIRAGKQGCLINELLKGHIGVGWLKNVDMTNATTLEKILCHFVAAHPEKNTRMLKNQALMMYKFRSVLKRGDKVITYNTKDRSYLLGTVVGDYRFSSNTNRSYSHLRNVKWELEFGRDDLSLNTRNSLRSSLTLFAITRNILKEIQLIYFWNKYQSPDLSKKIRDITPQPISKTRPTFSFVKGLD